MPISAEEVSRILKAKNIDQLFHANTVLTTLSYLRSEGLLSRGAVEDRRLPQTPQCSDDQDKQLGIWYDIFFDSADIHHRANELNKYGPVTLVFDPRLILIGGLDIRITRDNPIRWTESVHESERYFTSTAELAAEYKKGAFCQHLTLHNVMSPLPLKPYLQSIIIDNPQLHSNEHFEKAYRSLQEIVQKNYSDVDLVVRKCTTDCTCTAGYKSLKPGFIWHKYRIK